jgi:hypothetical protein
MKFTLKKNSYPHILLVITFLCVGLLGILSVAVPPGADPDPCRGFLVMRSMEQGGGFNLLVSPNPQNILKDHSLFLAWWSPGQYLLPYFFKLLLKVNTGRAAAITVSFCSLLGLAGFFKLYKKLGFTQWVAAVSIAFIASQLFFILTFVYYPGGEVLLFAFSGWFLYGCVSFERINWQVVVFVFFGLLVGFFSKSSALWIYAAGMACLWINVSLNERAPLFTVAAKASSVLTSQSPVKKTIRIWLLNGMLLAIPFIAAFGIIYAFYLSKGPNPSDSYGRFLIKPETFSFPLASPIISGFSIDEWLDGLIYHPEGQPVVSYHAAVVILFVLAFCSLGFVTLMVTYSPGRKYTILLLTFYVLGVLFFSYMFLKQATITYEGRHFRIIGLLATPGIVYLLFKTKIIRILFFAAWLAVTGMGVNFFVNEFNENREAPRGNSGLSQQGYDGAALQEIMKIDAHSSKSIFVVTSPDVALEIIHNRVITIEVENLTDKALSKLKYAGYGGPLYMLLPAEYVTGSKITTIIKSFVNYHHFTAKRLSDNYYLYFADK